MRRNTKFYEGVMYSKYFYDFVKILLLHTQVINSLRVRVQKIPRVTTVYFKLLLDIDKRS